ncbi:MAG: DUF1577 domain-containing protein [Spirochaetota bacterium]
MEEAVDRQKRDMDLITEKEKKILILSKYLNKQSLRVKGMDKVLVKLKEFSRDGSRIIVEGTPNLNLVVGDHISLSKLLARYVQLDCEVVKLRPFQHFELKIDELHIAKKERSHKRIKPPEGHVWITNIRTSRASLDTSELNTIPTYVKINFSDYENKLKSTFDFIKIDVFHPGLDEKFYIVRKTGKTLYIENTQKDECYESFDDDFVDYQEELLGDVNRAKFEYKNKKIVSEVIMPVIYLNPYNEASPIGYVHIQSQTYPITHDKVMEAKILTFEMIDRIRESNTLINRKRFPIIDMSEGGVRILIDDQELIDQLPHQLGFTFDIYYKLQSPMTMYGLIRYVAKDPKGKLILGLNISGSSNTSADRERYLNNLESMLRSPDLHIMVSD